MFTNIALDSDNPSKSWNIFLACILQTRCSWGCSTNTFVIDEFSEWSFSSRSSKHHHCQTVRARKLKFWENVHLSPPAMSHVSHVTCHMPHVMFHISHVTGYFFLLLLFFFFLQSGGASRLRVCYQQGRASLVSKNIAIIICMLN